MKSLPDCIRQFLQCYFPLQGLARSARRSFGKASRATADGNRENIAFPK
jgi:hypothetical protein